MGRVADNEGAELPDDVMQLIFDIVPFTTAAAACSANNAARYP